jgi:hypothetical protein
VFQQVTSSAGRKGTVCLNVTRIRCQNDNAGTGKRGANSFDGLNAVHAGQLQVHQRDIRPKLPEEPEPFLSGCRLADQFHIRLRLKRIRDSIAHNGVIVNTQHSDLL